MKRRTLAIAVWLLAAGCRGGTESADVDGDRRERMIQLDIEGRGVRDPAVLRAMREVPRHEFVPAELRNHAYEDHPLPIGLDQTISQPYLVAAMTELLKLDADDVVLEVGSGSGYQAAVLARIVPRVYTIEILPELGQSADERLQRLGYTNVVVKVGDGYAGWPEHAPFDGIIVTCGAEEVPPPLLEQLKPGGRMVIPVGPSSNAQSLKLIEKRADGSVVAEDIMPVRFVPLTGEEGRK